MRLAGKVAIITGAASGIGHQIAYRFAQEGAHLVCADLNAGGAEGVSELASAAGLASIGAFCDVSKQADVDALVAKAVAEFGRVDILVANAGISEPVPFLELTEEAWDRTLDVNLKGVFLCGQAAARQMVAQGEGGCIINIASIMAEVGAAGAAAYCASKGGVTALTRAMAVALAPQEIRVNAIAPGFLDTRMTLQIPRPAMDEIKRRTPQERVGHPSDIAAIAVLLASIEGTFITGSTITVDGGFTAGLYFTQPQLVTASERAGAAAES